MSADGSDARLGDGKEALMEKVKLSRAAVEAAPDPKWTWPTPSTIFSPAPIIAV
jgi:hypothetical protein